MVVAGNRGRGFGLDVDLAEVGGRSDVAPGREIEQRALVEFFERNDIGAFVGPARPRAADQTAVSRKVGDAHVVVLVIPVRGEEGPDLAAVEPKHARVEERRRVDAGDRALEHLAPAVVDVGVCAEPGGCSGRGAAVILVLAAPRHDVLDAEVAAKPVDAEAEGTPGLQALQRVGGDRGRSFGAGLLRYDVSRRHLHPVLLTGDRPHAVPSLHA